MWVKYDAPDLFFRPGSIVNTFEEAQAIADANGWKIYSISKKASSQKSAFEPHYNHGLGMWIDDRRQYREELKRRNLIEVGTEKLKHKSPDQNTNYFSDECIRAINNAAGGLSDAEIRDLKSGK